uniref:Dienelactone hydrolase domain-containing protein n=1 Tax=Salix viminalis TaxID=40686 RepID=A0A6N2MGD7_SALVM
MDSPSFFIASTVPHSFHSLKSVSIAVDHCQTLSSSQCLENPPNLTPGYGGGTVQESGGLETYVTGPSDSNLAILLLSDVLGKRAHQAILWVCLFTKLVFDRLLSSSFPGFKAPNLRVQAPLCMPVIPAVSYLLTGLAGCSEKAKEDAKMVIGALKTKGMNSIGAAGFCWGVKLASSNAFLGAEIDRASPPEQLKEFRELLSAKSQAMGPQPQV